MTFKLNRNKKQDPPFADVEKPLGDMTKEVEVVRETITQQEVGSVEEVLGQSVMDPTAELTKESLSETVSTQTVEETVSVTVQVDPTPDTGTVPASESESEVTGPAEVVEQEITSRGEEVIHTEPPLIETCKAAIVGPASAIAAAAAPSTALAVVKQEGTAVVKKPVISARMLKTWGRSVKGDKANILLPGVHPDFAGDLVITKLVDNPKLPNKAPWLRFAKYRNGMTVAEYVKACERLTTAKVSQADLKWDVNHGYIRVTAAESLAPPAVQEQAA